MTMRNLMITMLLGGLWHGAGIFFIVWGLYHGLLLVLYRLVPIDTFLTQRLGRFGKACSIVIFFHLVCLGWVFFRSTPAEFLPIVKSIAALPNAVRIHITPQVANWSWSPSFFSHLIGSFITNNWIFAVYGWGFTMFAIPAVLTDFLGWRYKCEFPDLFSAMPWWLRSAVIVGLFYGIVFFARREANEFIYFAF
jgi:D-alanyl-lipoteichoic acid acyltransferase DltB (MBOAT superfamily)